MEHHRETKRIRKKNLECEAAEKKPMGISGAQKRKKKKEKEELALDVERLKLRTDEVVDRVGRASQGCVRLARLVEIEYDDRWFFAKANTESPRCACTPG